MAIAAMKVPTIFTAIDRYSDVVTRMTMRTSAFGKTAEAAAMRTSRAFNTAGTRMLTAGVGMAVGIGYSVNEAMKFEKAMANVNTTIDSTPQIMKELSSSVIEMSKRTPTPLAELTDGLYDVVSAGIETKHAMKVLDASARLGVAGLGTAKEGVDVITSSLNSFNLSAERSEKVANMVFKAVKYGKTTVSELAESFGSSSALVKNSNVSLEEYLATTAVLTTTGMTASRAQTQVASAITALIKPSGSMSKVFAKLGVKDVPLWIKNNGGLVSSLKIVRDQAEKMGILTSKAFGRKEGFSAMLSLLGPLKDKYKEVMLDMVGSADTLSEAFDKQQVTLASKVQLMKNNLTVLAIKIGDVLIPRIKDLVDSIIPVVQNIGAWTERNKGFTNTLMTVAKWLLILGVVAKVGAVLFYGLGKIFAFVTFISRAYAFSTQFVAAAQLAQALTGASLTTVMWGLAASLLAAYWPVLLILGALGLLAYSMSDTLSSTESMVSGQISALDKGNLAMINSTKIKERELNKQRKLMETPSPQAQNGFMTKGLLVPLVKRKEEEKARIAALPPMAVYSGGALFDSSGKPNVVKSVPNEMSDPSQRENLAGGNKLSEQAIMDFLSSKGGKLDLNITAPNGYGVDVEGTPPSGIEVNTKSNQGSR